MGMICVNEFTAASATDTPRCVASWSHTQQQVIYGAYLLLVLLVFAATWSAFSIRQKKTLRKGEIGFSLSLRRWARTSRAAAIVNRPLQLVVSFVIYGITLSRCQSYDVSEWHYYTVLLFYVVALVDDAVRFLAARYKVLYCLSPLTLVEILCLASTIEVGFGPTRVVNGVETRSWLDFSIMRPVFILRSYLEIDKHLPRSNKAWMMVRLGIKILLMIMVGASAMFFLETLGEMAFFSGNGFAHLYTCSNGTITRDASSDCSSETWSVMFSFYFTVVTLGTVGYGDNSPKTVLSRLLAIMFIVMGVVLFSMEIDNLINLYNLRQIGNPSYKPKPDTIHVVIMGNPSFAQLSAILRELFHEDHFSDLETEALHAVVLGERKAKFSKELVAKLKADPIFAARVTYVAGTATRAEDLDRALARSAEAIFAFPDKLSDDPADEDAMNIMRVLAAKRYCGPSMRFLVLVLRAENARHMLAAGVERDDIICENVITMGSLAQSAQCNGISTMLSNLAASFSDVGEVDLSTPAPGDDMRINDKADLGKRGANKPKAAASQRDWLTEYYKGAGKEMYLIHLSKEYTGRSFSDASAQIFRDTYGTVVLFAVEITLSGNEVPDSSEVSMSRVLLNPGNSLILTEWIQCYVIADDLEQVIEHGICRDEPIRGNTFGSDRSGPILNPMADTFIDARTPRLGEATGSDEFRSLTAYSSLSTPNQPAHPRLPSPDIEQRRNLHTTAGIHTVILDSFLEHVALAPRAVNRTLISGNPYEHPMAGAEFRGTRTASMSITSDAGHSLDPPPLSVLLDPDHVVVCSFLGEEALASLQWLLFPLRVAHAPKHPPITILDAAEPSAAFVQALTPFQDVFYVRGSPLVYTELQRAGAKAASAVIILGKRGSNAHTTRLSKDSDIESSMADAEAIFTTMLVELKMDFSKIFTITELADEKNSKFLGVSFQIKHWTSTDTKADTDGRKNGFGWGDHGESTVVKFWDNILHTDAPQQESQQEIFGLPLYMSGRLLHPQLCENMLVQTYFNPSIHRIVRQLVGGPLCTGVIHSFCVPRRLRSGCTYEELFNAFGSSTYSGVCIGLYRFSLQRMGNGKRVELPIVITTPDASLEVVESDRVLVLLGTHTIDRAAFRIQRFYRRRRCRSKDRASSVGFSRSTISKYLGTDKAVDDRRKSQSYSKQPQFHQDKRAYV